MAARKRKLALDEKWREKIQASMLVNRLSDHVDGKVDLSATQVRAAEILLKKVAPDLAATQHSGDPENPVKHDVTVKIVDNS